MPSFLDIQNEITNLLDSVDAAQAASDDTTKHEFIKLCHLEGEYGKVDK